MQFTLYMCRVISLIDTPHFMNYSILFFFVLPSNQYIPIDLSIIMVKLFCYGCISYHVSACIELQLCNL